MRRRQARGGLLFVVLAAGAAALVACGLDAVGALAEGADTTGGPDGSARDADAGVDPVDVADGATDDGAPSTGPALPSHVPPATVLSDAAPLAAPIVIDTTELALDLGQGLDASLPPGIAFVVVDAGPAIEAGAAVLSVGSLAVTQAVRVTGARPLVIVSTGDVAIDAELAANARGLEPGPGGFRENRGPGVGTRGESGPNNADTGGGGAGHGTAGAEGADVGTTKGGAPGVAYATPLLGGSGGGRGQTIACGNFGGAGGGAVQIFSRTSITVSAGGGVNVGGGGGRGGCASGTSGGGGGSGGFLMLEAPSIRVAGILAANGGGGGGGGSANGPMGDVAGGAGADGALSAAAADGGAGGGRDDHAGGAGGATTAPVKPGPATFNGGGGGGAVGRILLRARGAAWSLDGGVVSPPPKLDPSL